MPGRKYRILVQVILQLVLRLRDSSIVFHSQRWGTRSVCLAAMQGPGPESIYHVIYIALVGVPEALLSFNDRLTAVSPAIL